MPHVRDPKKTHPPKLRRPKMLPLVVAGFALLLLSWVAFSSRTMSPEWKTYQNPAGNFTVQYPYAVHTGSNSVVFSGPDRWSRLLEIRWYENQRIQSVIADREKLPPFTRPDATVIAKDVKVNTCTFRKIDVVLPKQNSAYYFLDHGRRVIFFAVENVVPSQQGDIDRMVSSFTCL
ncbi:MAG: hypothetical protein PHI63_04010 [Patescibacteria group bacterium]|nr:hypothetical protein [Patescibacteria group bacterium]